MCEQKKSRHDEGYQFKDAFVKRITRMVKPYDEERIIFDCYDIVQSPKQKTRAKRAQGKETEFAVHDEMDIAKITLKELLSASKTKVLLSNILGNALMEEYKGSKQNFVVVKRTTVQINQHHSLAESMSTRNHYYFYLLIEPELLYIHMCASLLCIRLYSSIVL